MPNDRAPYSRVYHAIVDDPKFAAVYDDDRRLATWLRLLIVAEQAHPASAYIPTGTNRAAVTSLVDAGLIDLGSGSRFRIHGLDAERERRSEPGRIGAVARWSDSERNANAMRTHTSRIASPKHAAMPDETSIDETSRDEQDARTEHGPDPWDDPEGEAVAWLAKHGCALLPSSGYYRHLVVMVEHHGVNAVVGMFDRLATAGTHEGDVKGYIFGARDALDAKTRPKLGDLAKEERTEEIDAAHHRRLAATQRNLAELRGETA